MDKLERAEKILQRIQRGDYTIEFYYYLDRELKELLQELKSEAIR
jgi:hypothetical protein